MPVTIPHKLPAIKALEEENIFVMDEARAMHQDIRPLRIAVLNLMPVKITTETDLIRLLSNTPLQLKLDLIKVMAHTPKNTPAEHMEMFYSDFEHIKNNKYDGLIVTGAPVELLDFEDVNYWEEMRTIFEWAEHNVQSSLFICWASMAALYHYYGIPKYPLPQKKFGVFHHTVKYPKLPMFRGFDDEFHMPHSRHSEIRAEDVEKIPGLEVIAESDEAGVGIIQEESGRKLYVTGHFEYSTYNLDDEYKRDLAKGMDTDVPKHYYKKNNPEKNPVVRWRGHANLFFQNWLNYHVYQQTPFDIDDIK
ncbi:MAG: homoserine O-succinyltransferase [Prolixibacteraceae bacterium]|jgi:homoserine O-succinyltransferase|nr:homoserine O-succinyltransferase [Prolixibacteraceae bacterium]